MREKLQRLAMTVAALAVTVGVVFAMRELTQDIVVRFGLGGGAAEVGAPEMPWEPAPRTYDLGEIIPPELAFNVGGMQCVSRVRHELAPTDVALARVLAEAEAQGWQRLQPTLVDMMREPGLAMEESFVTPQGEFVSYGVLPSGEGASRVSEWRFPFAGVARPSSAAGSPLQEASTQCGPEIRRRLPSVIADIVEGNPIASQLVPRNGGHGYYLTVVASGEPAAVEKRFGIRATLNGWARTESYAAPGAGRYTKDNLALFCQFIPYTRGESVVIFRFSDDENLISKKGNNP